MKTCVTTSDNYHHCLRIFIYLFNKNWSDKQEVEIVGYKHPDFELPPNFIFYSMGEQGKDANCFSGDLRKYFEKQGDWFVWLMEDYFIKGVNKEALDYLWITKSSSYGRVDLSWQAIRGPNELEHNISTGIPVYKYSKDRSYRLSTQASIWNKKYLLQYLNDGMNPWDFERQHPINDGWDIVGPGFNVLSYNEGVTKHDIHLYDLNGIPEEQIGEMKQLGIL